MVAIVSVLHCKARDAYQNTAFTNHGHTVIPINMTKGQDEAQALDIVYATPFVSKPKLSVQAPGVCPDSNDLVIQVESATGFSIAVSKLTCAFVACEKRGMCHTIVHWHASMHRVSGTVSSLVEPAQATPTPPTSVGYLSAVPHVFSFPVSTTSGYQGDAIAAHLHLASVDSTLLNVFPARIGIPDSTKVHNASIL